jgi:hypothetical protein
MTCPHPDQILSRIFPGLCHECGRKQVDVIPAPVIDSVFRRGILPRVDRPIHGKPQRDRGPRFT